jgi:hypothetical protein
MGSFHNSKADLQNSQLYFDRLNQTNNPRFKNGDQSSKEKKEYDCSKQVTNLFSTKEIFANKQN